MTGIDCRKFRHTIDGNRDTAVGNSDPSIQPRTMREVRTEELARRLREARDRTGLSQEHVAGQLRLPRSAISDLETGKREVAARELISLAQLYSVDVEELLAAEPLLPPDQVSLRAAAISEESRTQLSRWSDKARSYAELEILLGEPQAPDLRPVSKILSTFEQAHELADEERRRLGLGLTPAHQLIEVLEERVGIKVLYLDLDDGLSGASTVGRDFGPCILVNARHPAGRRVFTLAHEYFHLLTNGRVARSQGARGIHLCEPQTASGRKDRGEQLADQFAGRLLLPNEHFTERLRSLLRADGTIDKLDLVGVAHYFGVSVQAVFVQLAALKLVTWEVARAGYEDPALLAQIGATATDHGARPVRFGRLAAKAYAAGLVSRSRLAQLLDVNVADVERELERLGGAGGDGGIRVALSR